MNDVFPAVFGWLVGCWRWQDMLPAGSGFHQWQAKPPQLASLESCCFTVTKPSTCTKIAQNCSLTAIDRLQWLFSLYSNCLCSGLLLQALSPELDRHFFLYWGRMAFTIVFFSFKCWHCNYLAFLIHFLVLHKQFHVSSDIIENEGYVYFWVAVWNNVQSFVLQANLRNEVGLYFIFWTTFPFSTCFCYWAFTMLLVQADGMRHEMWNEKKKKITAGLIDGGRQSLVTICV